MGMNLCNYEMREMKDAKVNMKMKIVQKMK